MAETGNAEAAKTIDKVKEIWSFAGIDWARIYSKAACHVQLPSPCSPDPQPWNAGTLERWNLFLPIGEGVTHVFPGPFRQAQEFLHDLGMFSGHIARLTDITLQIVKAQFCLDVIITGRCPASSRLTSPPASSTCAADEASSGRCAGRAARCAGCRRNTPGGGSGAPSIPTIRGQISSPSMP